MLLCYGMLEFNINVTGYIMHLELQFTIRGKIYHKICNVNDICNYVECIARKYIPIVKNQTLF